MSDNRVEEVLSCFEKSSCSQAIFSVYGQYFGVDRDTCLKISSLFSGGIHRTGNVCGAVTGALMAIGLKHGKADDDEAAEAGTGEVDVADVVAKIVAEDVNVAADEFVKKFKDRNVTIICRELIDHDLLTVEDIAHAFKTNAFKDCHKYVRDAAEILEEML